MYLLHTFFFYKTTGGYALSIIIMATTFTDCALSQCFTYFILFVTTITIENTTIVLMRVLETREIKKYAQDQMHFNHLIR